MTASIDVVVFRSAKLELTYLYVPAATKPDALPPAIIALGPWHRSFAFPLTPGRKLAQADAAKLLKVKPGAPLLAINRTAMSFRDRPVELRRSLVNTAAHEYASDLGRTDGLS